MGGGDLNMKKSWHTGTFANQERVWKKEKEALEERKKLQQLQKEQEQERAVQELQRLQEQAGGRKREERVDWMYAAPAEGSGPNPDELEAYLLGKKRVDKLLKGNEEKLLAAPADANAPGGSFQSVQNANSARDTAAKIREDPLLAIKRQEQAQYEKMMKDPRKRRELLAAREAASGGASVRGSGAGESKEERRARKEARRAERDARHGHRRDDRDRSRSPARHSSSRRDDRRERERSRSPRRDERRERDHRRPSREYDDERRRRAEPSSSSHRDGPTSHRDGPSSHRPDRPRSPPPPPRDTRAPHDDRRASRAAYDSPRRSPPRSAPSHAHRAAPYPPPQRRAPPPAAAAPSAADEEARQAALAARLAAMQSSASSLATERAARLKEAEAADALELEREKRERERKGEAGPSFLSSVQGKVFGGEGGLGERMRRSGRVGMVGDRDD